MAAVKHQSALFRGIYEFEDPSGGLMAVRVPQSGSADLYKGTAVIVRPNQCAVIIYKGEIADVLGEGLHQIETENVPILTRIANWKFGFTSPLRCEIWFFSGAVFTARRWGTSSPVMVPLQGLGTTPLRAFGNYSVVLKNPLTFYKQIIGSRTSFDITEVEDFIQGHLTELLPKALSHITALEQIGAALPEVAKKLQAAVGERLAADGLAIRDLQVLGVLPTKEILQALDAKAAMKVLGNQREYLLYKAANSLEALPGSEGGDNPMQMMLALMLGKGLAGADYREKETATAGAIAAPQGKCGKCQGAVQPNHKFCPNCGKEIA